MLLIGGTAYAGEMKKGIFTVMNYWLPQQGVLPMHCAANVGAQGDTALFFGLSGTGKTTLSADATRQLIGDDEHGWSEQGVFNLEGGCYAKTYGLSAAKEPQIHAAIRFGSILENVCFIKGTHQVAYDQATITENTRTAYPITYIPQAIQPSVGGVPKNIFLLTCDAYGVLPPLARLTPAQAMYHFLAGYTAKVAGTEVGINTPQAVFSACFGTAFLPLPPATYVALLGQRLAKHKVSVWLVNTGWIGGPVGTGQRISLSYTRCLIQAALAGDLEAVPYQSDAIFGLSMPLQCPGVPAEVLDPVWKDQAAYTAQAAQLAQAFTKNLPPDHGLVGGGPGA